MRHLIQALATAAVLVLAACVARAEDFVVHSGGDSKVVFTSRAMTESFEGKTNRMEGTLSVNPGAVGDSISVHLEVDLASLDTGSKLRNTHMRNNHLETATYPKAVFDGAAVVSPVGATLPPGKPVTFELEGVSRRMRCAAEATYVPTAHGGRLAFVATFPVLLSDYSIKRPEFLFLKLAETQQVRVSGTASSQP
jgi:polyisoprenoid-binding protein YceI